MGYDAIVKKNVQKAFKTIGDLASTVTLSQKNSNGFNFATQVVSATSITTKVIKGLLVEQKKPLGGSKGQPLLSTSLQMAFQFQSTDLKDPDIYDTITMQNGEVWKMVPPYKDDGYLITVNVSKEA